MEDNSNDVMLQFSEDQVIGTRRKSSTKQLHSNFLGGSAGAARLNFYCCNISSGLIRSSYQWSLVDSSDSVVMTE